MTRVGLIHQNGISQV